MNNQRRPCPPPASLVKGRWRRSAGGISACCRLLSFNHPSRGRACPARNPMPYPFCGQFVGEGFIPPGQLPAAASLWRRPEGWPPYDPHLKSVRRAGCPHPAETYRHPSFPHRRPVGAGHARPARERQAVVRRTVAGRTCAAPTKRQLVGCSPKSRGCNRRRQVPRADMESAPTELR
mgnify:CR=1 FL=1